MAALPPLVRCEQAAGAIEFALILPLALAFFVAVFEFAHAYQVQSELTAVAHDTVRRIATKALAGDAAERYVRDRLAGSVDALVEVAVREEVLPDDAGTDVRIDLSLPLANVLTFCGGLLPSPGSAADGSPLLLKATATMLKS